MIDRVVAAIDSAMEWARDHDGLFFGAVVAVVIIMHLGGI